VPLRSQELACACSLGAAGLSSRWLDGAVGNFVYCFILVVLYGGFVVIRLMRVATVAAGLLAVSALISGASAQVQQTSSTHPSLGFWAVATPGESFSQVAQNAAGGASRGQVSATIEAMIKRAEAGRPVYVPQGTGRSVVSVRASVPGLRAALSAVRRSDRSLLASGAVAVSGSLVLSGPDSFPVGGSGCGGIEYDHNPYFGAWCEMPFALNGDYCGADGCTIVNELRAEITANPGSVTSSISYTSQLFRLIEGDTVFAAIHFQWWTLCYSNGQIRGNENTENFYGNSSDTFLTDAPGYELHGNKMTLAFTYTALFIPNGSNYLSSAKTATATCVPASDGNGCLYPDPNSRRDRARG
jgi:hypothetical protein